MLAEYIWLGGTPLAFVQSGQTYHVHVDHLGTPKALTDASGQVVWKASYSPFGKASVTTQGPAFNLRFPGQYYDAETGLHYNWRRYYDPATGRYITSDPIGLAGGINTYAYVENNPYSLFDLTGECPWCAGAIYGGLSGAVGGYITGGWMGALKGGLVGAAVGVFSPFGSGVLGIMANNASASYLGQVIGNTERIYNSKSSCTTKESPFENINYSAVIGASIGGAFTAGKLGNLLMRPYIPRNIIGKPLDYPGFSLAPTNALGAVGEGVGAAAGETFAPWYGDLWKKFISDLRSE
ncbi:RHS repeat domain-containing protein [Shewanella profunda]|uniref:RHS repeat domain-containing protein n=1 Tax=Shewanella profunda TaxID=254793 RepID=UPI0035D806BF